MVSRLGALTAACALTFIASSTAAAVQNDRGSPAAGPRPPPVAIDPCALPDALKWSYERMSVRRTETILNLDVIPTDRRADFRSAFDRFNAALDTAMNREIDVLGRYFYARGPECAAAPEAQPGVVVQIEEAKVAALRDYVRALSSLMSEDRAEELVETDLQMIRAIEVRLRALAYEAVHSRPAE